MLAVVLIVLWLAAFAAWAAVGRSLDGQRPEPARRDAPLPRRALALALLVAAGTTTAGPAWGQNGGTPTPSPDARRVTLDEALALFAEHNLGLRLARAEAAEAAGLAVQARAYPNPVAGASFDPLFGDAVADDGFQFETAASISQRIEWGDVRRARTEAAEGLVVAARARGRADSLRLAFEVVQAYVEAATAEERTEQLGAVAMVVRTATTAAENRYDEGDLAGFDLRRLRVEQARYETALELAALDASAARRRLALLILPEDALQGGADVRPVATLDALPPEVLLADALGAAELNRPEVDAARAEVASARAALEAARLERRPSPTVSAGVQRQQGGLYGPTVGLSLPIPVFDRNTGQIAAEQARLAQAETRLALAERRVEADVRGAYETYASLARRVALVRGELLTGTEDLLATARVAYGEGALSLVELLDAADAYREARVVSTGLLADYTAAYYDLLRSAGGTLVSPTTTPPSP
jgi:cobalt-zinc-cadmium efflux system outer membrane protein